MKQIVYSGESALLLELLCGPSNKSSVKFVLDEYCSVDGILSDG